MYSTAHCTVQGHLMQFSPPPTQRMRTPTTQHPPAHIIFSFFAPPAAPLVVAPLPSSQPTTTTPSPAARLPLPLFPIHLINNLCVSNRSAAGGGGVAWLPAAPSLPSCYHSSLLCDDARTSQYAKMARRSNLDIVDRQVGYSFRSDS